MSKETREILTVICSRARLAYKSDEPFKNQALAIDKAEAALDALIAEKVAEYTYDKRVADNCRMVADSLGAVIWMNPLTNKKLYNEAAVAEKIAEAELSQINKGRAVVLAYFTTGEQLKAFREMAEGIRAALTSPAEQAEKRTS